MAEQKVEHPVYDPNSGRCKVCGGETLWGDAPHADGCGFARVAIGQNVFRLKEAIAARNQNVGRCLLCGAVDLNKHYERCPLRVKEVGNG